MIGKRDFEQTFKGRGPPPGAQLAEQLIPTPEVRGLNHGIGEFLKEHLFAVNFVGKTKIKKKRSGMAHLKKLLNDRRGGDWLW